MFGRFRIIQPAPAHPTDTPPPGSDTDAITVPAAPAAVTETRAETAALERETAQRARHDARHARQQAAGLLEAARTEAARLVAEAETEAARLTVEAQQAERDAGRHDEHAGLLENAVALRTEIDAAQQHADHLTAEAETLAGEDTVLAERLEQLGTRREDAGVRLAAARQDADVDAVTACRAELGSIDEVVRELTGQRQTLEDRQRAIGPGDGSGELADALRDLNALHARLRALENLLDPTRPEAVADEFLAVVQANADRIREQAQTASTPPRNLVIRR